MAGGGVGEAMLIGAAMGAGTGAVTSAIDKKDPLQGALMGGITGGAMGGLGSAVGGALTPAAEQGAQAVASQGVGQLGQQGAAQATQAMSQMPNLAAKDAATAALAQGSTPFPTQAISQAAPQAGGIADWMSAGKGAGFAPDLTNAQAYGAGITGGIGGLSAAQNLPQTGPFPTDEGSSSPLNYFKYDPKKFKVEQPTPVVYQAHYADGGIASLGNSSPINNPIYPQSQQQQTAFATSPQMPNSMRSAMASDYDAKTDPGLGTELPMGYASGGISSLGGYSDGGRLLRGPGDGVSDSIPASIGGKQPARLADGEFVVPSRIVSELGNGSTDAGARRLYDMMDRVQRRRASTVGKGKVAKNTKSYEALPA